MSQLSLFSADLTPPMLADLGGVMAGPGQIVRTGVGARLSLLLDDRWRGRALIRELRVRDVDATLEDRDGRTWVHTDATTVLLRLAAEWTRGASKAVPPGLQADAGFLRCWTIAVGRPDDIGFLLGLDPRAVQTHEVLAAVIARAGMAATLLGMRSGGPALRIVGHRRLARLAELVGTPPPEAPKGAFPVASR